MSVHVDVTQPLATVRLDQPERPDGLDLAGWGALAEAFASLSDRTDVACVVVRGGGRTFATRSPVRGTPEDVRGRAGAIATALRQVRACRHPTVAIVEGICVGAVLEIAACCDLRVCGESSRFGAPIDRLGPQPLAQLLGASPVLEVLLSGEMIDAERARLVGLVNRVHPDRAVVEQGYRLAARVAAGAPLVNRWHKNVVRNLLERVAD